MQSEKEVVAELESCGYEVKDSSRDDDMHYDIDCHCKIDPETLGPSDEWCDVSIKTQHACLKHGCIVFELVGYDSYEDKWKPSWFHTGRAKLYLVRVGEEVYGISKQHLLTWLGTRGGKWPQVRQLTEATKSYLKQQRYTDYANGWVRLNTLVKAGVARLMFTVPIKEEGYVPANHRT